MFNVLFGFVFIILNLSITLLIYKFFGKIGLFAWIGVATILANIQVVKTIEIFALTATLGNALYGSIFLSTDILSEKYGKKDAKTAIWLGFIASITMILTMSLALLFEPGSFDVAQPALEILFGVVPRVVIGSLCAYLVSQMIDILLFAKIKEKWPSDKYLWLRNNGSTMISQLIDSLIFVSIAFLGMYEMNVFLEILLTTYFIKVIVAVLDTPFIYLSKKIKPKNEE